MSADGGTPPHLPIDEVVIDPKAEIKSTQPGKASAQDETRFFTEDAARYKLLADQQSLGHLGKLWGSSSSAPTNIAGMLLLLCFITVCLSFALTQTPDLIDARKWLYGLTTTVLGFLFGSRTSGKND